MVTRTVYLSFFLVSHEVRETKTARRFGWGMGARGDDSRRGKPLACASCACVRTYRNYDYLLGDARKIDVIASEVGVHSVIDVRHVVLDVNLLIDGILARLLEVTRAGERVAAVGSHRVLVTGLDDGLKTSAGREDPVRARRGREGWWGIS